MNVNQLSKASHDHSEAIYGLFELVSDVILALDEVSIRNCLAESTVQELLDRLAEVKEAYYGI